MATVYHRGSGGQEVVQIQRRLQALGHYAGPLDGDFGGGTEAAVKAFQRNENLTVDGKVGPQTWAYLLPKEEIQLFTKLHVLSKVHNANVLKALY